MSAKELALALIRRMPDDVTADDLVAALDAELLPASEDEGATEPSADVTAAWADEINRRIADLESGRVKGIPAEEVFRKLREKYG